MLLHYKFSSTGQCGLHNLNRQRGEQHSNICWSVYIIVTPVIRVCSSWVHSTVWSLKIRWVNMGQRSSDPYPSGQLNVVAYAPGITVLAKIGDALDRISCMSGKGTGVKD
jgi:hypothetical protein